MRGSRYNALKWDAKLQAKLEKLAQQGYSCGQIATILGTTKSAITGRGHRTGVTFCERVGGRPTVRAVGDRAYHVEEYVPKPVTLPYVAFMSNEEREIRVWDMEP